MRQYQDSTHIRVDEPDVNSARNLTHSESNFNFAVGFLNSNTFKPETIETYGFVEVSIFDNRWEGYLNENGEYDFKVDYKPMDLRPCNQIDIEENFYKAKPKSKAFFTSLMQNMTCLSNLEDLNLQGNTQTVSGESVVLEVKTC